MKLVGYALSAFALASAFAHAEPMVAANELRHRLDTLERSWDSSSAARQREYFVRAGELAANLAEYDPAEATAAALKMLSNALERMPPVDDSTDVLVVVRTADLGAIDKIALFLLTEGNLPFGSQSEKLTLLTKMLGRIRSEKIKDYVPPKVPRNVSPPPGGTEIRVSGMDPKAIEDPEDRAIYEEAIRQNSRTKAIIQRQIRLQRLDAEYSSQIVDLIERASIAGKISDQIVQQAIEQARLSSDEKASIAKRTEKS